MSGLVGQLADIRSIRVSNVTMIEGFIVRKFSAPHRWWSEMDGRGAVVPNDQQKQAAQGKGADHGARCRTPCRNCAMLGQTREHTV